MSPLDDITRKREWGAGESDQRDLSSQFFSDNPNRLHEKRNFLFRFDEPQSLHISSLPEGMMKNRALPFGEFKLHPHRFQGDEDIGENDGRIELELLNGLERHARRE